MGFRSFKLLESFSLDGQIKIDGKFGLLRVMRAIDGTLILVQDADYGLIDQKQPTKQGFVRPTSVLGFILDVGVEEEKILSDEGGFYFGTLMKAQRQMLVRQQQDFDQKLFNKICTEVDTLFQSRDSNDHARAMKLRFLLDTYNSASLLFPDHYSESYLGLLRIIDALSAAKGRYDFAIYASGISPKTNQAVYRKLMSASSYRTQVNTAIQLFGQLLASAPANCVGPMQNIKKKADKVVFSCFYIAYQYRSKFVHQGFPFPDKVKEGVSKGQTSAARYLSPVQGVSYMRIYRPGANPQQGDLIDLHTVLPLAERREFKRNYFPLLPKWSYMRLMAKEALLNEF